LDIRGTTSKGMEGEGWDGRAREGKKGWKGTYL